MNNGIPSGALIGQFLIRNNRLKELTNVVFDSNRKNKFRL